MRERERWFFMSLIWISLDEQVAVMWFVFFLGVFDG